MSPETFWRIALANAKGPAVPHLAFAVRSEMLQNEAHSAALQSKLE